MADSAIIKYIQGWKWGAQTPETQRLTKRAVFDLVGCAIAGSRHNTVPGVIASIEKIDGRGANAVWGTSAVLDVKGAVFLNAYTGALFDMDDGHRRAQGHPGAVLVPAALTVGARLQLSGIEILEAIAVGYDVAVREAVRIREAGGPRKGSSGWCGPGAAVTVGKLLKLTDEQMTHALGLSEYFTPQAGQDRSVAFPSMAKEGIPWGAYTGSFCAHLAAGGFTGHRPHLADAAELCADLGSRIEIEYTYYKKWAACRWAHPALAGLDMWKGEKKMTIKDVKHVKISSFEKALNLSNRKPESTLQAVYSIPFSLAYCLKHGRIEPDDLLDEAAMVQDPEILDMAQRIDMEEKKEYTGEFPLKCIQDITVTMQDGTTWSKEFLESPWDAGERAPTDEDMERKFRTLAEPVLGARWKALADAIKSLETMADVSVLVGMMTVH